MWDESARRRLGELGRELFVTRVVAEVRQYEVCAHCGMSAVTLGRWERGYAFPSAPLLVAWAGYFVRQVTIVRPDGGPVTSDGEAASDLCWEDREVSRIVGALRGERVERGLPIWELAEVCGLSMETLGGWERRTRRLSGLGLVTWAAGLGFGVELREVDGVVLWGGVE